MIIIKNGKVYKDVKEAQRVENPGEDYLKSLVAQYQKGTLNNCNWGVLSDDASNSEIQIEIKRTMEPIRLSIKSWMDYEWHGIEHGKKRISEAEEKLLNHTEALRVHDALTMERLLDYA